MNPQSNLRFYDGSYSADAENKRNDNTDNNLSVSKKDHSLSPARRLPLSAISDNNVNKTTGNAILLTGAVRVPIKDVQIITPSKSASKSIVNGTKSGSASKLNSQLKGGVGFMRHTESSSNHTIISTPTRNSVKRDDKPPSTDAKKKNNGSNGKQSKASDIGGLVVDSNITTEVVLHTPTRPNSVGKQRRATTPTVTPTSTPARQQKNFASHTASSESKFVGPTKSPIRSKDAITKISSANQSDSFAIYQAEVNGGSSQSILFSPDRSEASHSVRATSATKPDPSSRHNFRAFIGSPHTAEHEISNAYSNEKEKPSIHSSSHQVRSASRSHSKISSVKVTTASTTADILSANKAAKIAAMASVKGVPVTSSSAQPNRFSSRPRSATSHKGQLKVPSADSDNNESAAKKSNLHSNKRLKNDGRRDYDEDGDIKNAFNFVESSRSLIGSEHVQHATRSAAGSQHHRIEANKYFGNQKNSFSLCELSSVGDNGEVNRSAASTIELSGSSSYFLESNTQYLSFNADSFRSGDFYDPANNFKQSATDDKQSIEVDTLNLSIVESPASVSPSKISLGSFWSQSSDGGVFNSTEQSSAGGFSHAAVNGNMRAYSRLGAKNHNSNTATVNAMTNFHLKEPKENSSSQGLDARYSDSFSLNGLPNAAEERKVPSDSNIPSLYRNSLSTIRGSGSSLDMEGTKFSYKGDTGAVEVDQQDSPSIRLLRSSSQTSMNSILNNAMIASGSMISARSYPAEEDIETTSQLLNNCMLMSEDFDVKNIIDISDQPFNENTQDNGQGSFAESAILNCNDEDLNEESLIYLSQDNKNETFDTFIDDLRISEADCSYGSLTLFENLSNYIDALVASTGSVDFHAADGESKRQQQLMESISLPLGFENISQFNISPFNESASVIQSSFSAIQAVDQPAFANCSSPATSEHSDSHNLLLSPPTALSRSIEYEPLRVNVLPMQSVNSTAAVSYLDVESNRGARKVPSSIFEGSAETFPPPIKVSPPSTKLGVSAINNHVTAATHSPASNSSISSYTSSFEELRQHNPSVITDMTKRPSQNGNSFSSIYCTPPRKGLLKIPISSPPPGTQSYRAFATEGVRTISRFMDDNHAADNNQGRKAAREETNASRASGICPDPIAKQLLKIEEKEQSLPMGIATGNVFVPVQMS